MNPLRQGWLVARREMRERARSKGLWAGLLMMVIVVIAAIVVPAMLESDDVISDVGFAGVTPVELPSAVVDQGEIVDVDVRVHGFDDVAVGEQAVRDRNIDVLVVDGQRLTWRDAPDEQLRTVVSGAIQLVAVQHRAAVAGIDPDVLRALVAPAPVENVELGSAPERNPDDETAAYIMSILLLLAVVTYGQLVLTGVVQEKSSRVVEVLLARMRARTLLAGKVVGIGLLGFGQFAVTALAALVATSAVDAAKIPAIGGDVVAWVVAWFVLGYAIYATAYGALGSLASRVEDASSVTAPVSTVLIAGYWASLVAVGSDAESAWSRFVSLFPATAPFAMPGRIALGAVAWWEPLLAVTLALTTIAALVVFGGRVYAGAILHAGPTLKLGEAWRGATMARDAAVAKTRAAHAVSSSPGLIGALLIGVGAAVFAAFLAVTHDFIVALAAGAGFYAIASRLVKAHQHAHH